MKKFLVALAVGGIMEMPEVRYQDYQIVEAESSQDARSKYNEINNCSYFYGGVIGEVFEEDGRYYTKQDVTNLIK